MPLSVSSDCKLMPYADDSAILFSNKEVNVTYDRLRKECLFDYSCSSLYYSLNQGYSTVFTQKPKCRKWEL